MAQRPSKHRTDKTDYLIEAKSGRVKDMPERLKPREIMDRMGKENVSDDILLSIILRSGARGTNVLDLARKLLQDYGSLTALASSSVEELCVKDSQKTSCRYKGLGKVKAQVLMAALQIGKNMVQETLPKRFCIKSPDDTYRLLKDHAQTLDTEIFWVLHLDAKNHLKSAPYTVTRGLLDASLVHPREVFREAIRSATAAIVVAHNHPSGDPSPSTEDLRITRQLVDAGKIIDIKLLDHVIIGKNRDHQDVFFSMREKGSVNFE